MGSKGRFRKGSRRRDARRTTIEPLEDRQMFSAEPLGGGIEQHALSAPDFWYDTNLERDLDSLLGDIEQTLASAHQLTGVTQARDDYGFYGNGQTVAVIDSGIAWDHPNLGNGFGANARVVGGWDFTEENDANPYDDGPAGSHGTHVAGIVGATSSVQGDSGVAPGVDLVGLRVFNDQGSGYFSWVEKALKWVHTNRNSFANPITAVNLSLGTSWNAATVPTWAALEDELAQLKADGIFIAVSAGNSFATYNAAGLSYPAASTSVVPVMSVDDSGSLSYFSQRHTRAIAAPGRSIRSTVPDYVGNQNGRTDDWANYSGTSMASPYVAGASVLVREAMQFVGYTNITEDTIYSHMMSTADEFLDAATKQVYKRLNVDAALDALVPDDEFGSTAATAHELGTIGAAASEVTGLVGMRSDVDYFRFTAGATGTVTFTANTTHFLDAVWAGDGEVSGPDGNTYTINVVAGQSYTFGLSTSDGIGYFDLTVSAEGVFTFADWGTITQVQTNDVASSGETWYRVQASQAGYLTAEAFFASASGSVELAWFDVNLQQAATGVAGNNGQRVDRLVNAGEQFYLRVTGTNSDVDFRLTNLVSQTGSTVSVTGTSQDDTLVCAGGGTQTVIVNGVAYNFAASTVSTIAVEGKAGDDWVTLKSVNTTALRATDVEMVTDLDAQAYVLKQDLGLRFSKSYYLNWSGLNEKWILGNSCWYIITPDGALRRGTGSSDLAANPFIAQFDASYYANPSLLHEAQVTATMLDQGTNNQVASMGLKFHVSYYQNWGGWNEKWVMSNSRQWHVITPDGLLHRWSGAKDMSGSTFVANIGSKFYENPSLLGDPTQFGILSVPFAQQLDQSLGLQLRGSYCTNWGGRGEKWIMSNAGQWYFITPNGGLYQWDGSRHLGYSTLVATLDNCYYANPTWLHDACLLPSATASVQSAAFSQLADELDQSSNADASNGTIAWAKQSGMQSNSIVEWRDRAGHVRANQFIADRGAVANSLNLISLHVVGKQKSSSNDATRTMAFDEYELAQRDDYDWLVNVAPENETTSLRKAFSQWDDAFR